MLTVLQHLQQTPNRILKNNKNKKMTTLSLCLFFPYRKIVGRLKKIQSPKRKKNLFFFHFNHIYFDKTVVLQSQDHHLHQPKHQTQKIDFLCMSRHWFLLTWNQRSTERSKFSLVGWVLKFYHYMHQWWCQTEVGVDRGRKFLENKKKIS